MTAISGALIALLAVSGTAAGAGSPVATTEAEALAADPQSRAPEARTSARANQGAANAISAAPAATAGSAIASSSAPSLPADTPVVLEILTALSSAKAKRGDKFQLRLAQPLALAGAVALPPGTTGVGEVVHVARRGASGKPGELLLAARYLEYQGHRVPLRGFKLGGTGKSRAELALSVGIALGLPGMFVTGGEIEIPAGTQASARTAQAVELGSRVAPAASDSIVPAAAAPTAGASTSAAKSITGEVVQ